MILHRADGTKTEIAETPTRVRLTRDGSGALLGTRLWDLGFIQIAGEVRHESQWLLGGWHVVPEDRPK